MRRYHSSIVLVLVLVLVLEGVTDRQLMRIAWFCSRSAIQTARIQRIFEYEDEDDARTNPSEHQ